MTDLKTGRMVFSVVEGGEVALTFPQPMTPATVAELEEFFALAIRGMRRVALHAKQAADAEAEYASWFNAIGGPHA